MQSFNLEAHIGADGMLRLNLPVMVKNADLKVTVTLQPITPKRKRRPAPGLAGKVKITGDVIAPVVPEEEWDALK